MDTLFENEDAHDPFARNDEREPPSPGHLLLELLELQVEPLLEVAALLAAQGAPLLVVLLRGGCVTGFSRTTLAAVAFLGFYSWHCLCEAPDSAPPPSHPSADDLSIRVDPLRTAVRGEMVSTTRLAPQPFF